MTMPPPDKLETGDAAHARVVHFSFFGCCSTSEVVGGLTVRCSAPAHSALQAFSLRSNGTRVLANGCP